MSIIEDREAAAVVHIETTRDVNGNKRRGCVVYNSDATAFDFVPDDRYNMVLSLQSAGYEIRPSTDIIQVTEEEWTERSEIWRYPASSRKFSNLHAERLWDSSLDSAQDQDLGESEGFGWFALFQGDHAILHTDSQGAVSVSVYDSEEETQDKWSELETAYEEFCDDEDEE